MKIGFLHSLIRKEEKLLIDEFRRHPEAELVMLDDRKLIFDLRSRLRPGNRQHAQHQRQPPQPRQRPLQLNPGAEPRPHPNS